MNDPFSFSDLDKAIDFGDKITEFNSMAAEKKEELVRAFVAQYGVKPDAICLVLAQEHGKVCFYPMLKSDTVVHQIIRNSLSLFPREHKKDFDFWYKTLAEVKYAESQEQVVDHTLRALCYSIENYLNNVLQRDTQDEHNSGY